MKTTTLIATSCISILMLTGCSTSYHSSGLGGGFSDTQLAPDIFRVNFRGNAYTSSEKAQDFAMLRAADLCLQHGFVCFALLDATDSSTAYSYTTSGESHTTGTAYVNGNTATYSGKTTYNPGETYTYYKPKSGLMIRGFAKKPDGIFTYDAAFLETSIKEKYHIK